MIAQLTVWAGMLLLCGSAFAQCPANFLDAGELSASAGSGKYREINVTKDLLLPKGVRIDSSYRQKSIQAAGDGAASDMRAVEIPAGLHLISGGRAAGGWWWIDNPKLQSTADQQFRFTIDLHANTGSRGETSAPARGGSQAVADVRVRVCVKLVN